MNTIPTHPNPITRARRVAQRAYVAGWRWGVACGFTFGGLAGAVGVVLALKLGMAAGGAP